MKSTEFTFDFDNESKARMIYDAITPEVKHKIPKVKADASVSKNKVTLSLLSTDTSSLRAACNSYLRWIKTALEVINKKY